MALEPDFGIQVTLVLPVAGNWEHLYTYYNHGAEPPFGGVRSDEVVEEAEWAMPQLDRATQHTETWIKQVRGLLNLPMIHDPDLPLTYDLKVGISGNVTIDLKMETLDMGIEWEKADNIVVFRPRPAFDLSWAGFLFYNKAIGDFINKIKEQP